MFYHLPAYITNPQYLSTLPHMPSLREGKEAFNMHIEQRSIYKMVTENRNVYCMHLGIWHSFKGAEC